MIKRPWACALSCYFCLSQLDPCRERK